MMMNEESWRMAMSDILKIRLKGEYIRLGQALKAVNLAEDGVDAKCGHPARPQIIRRG